MSEVPESIADGKFTIKKKIGAGCFGVIFSATNTETGEEVAVKVEDRNGCCPQLEHAAALLDVLRQPVQPTGFVECFYFGREGHWNCMVMTLLGNDLEAMFQKCGNRFTVATVVSLAEQMLCRIEYLHSKGVVHRDIKPENFMMGTAGRAHHVYLIDFGLSKRYFDKVHCPVKQKLSLAGTARYASINAHKGLEQSRRDDLVAIAYCLAYFLRGSLPWSGLHAQTQKEKYRKIQETKECTLFKELFEGYPDAFASCLEYCQNLQFKDRPDYDFLRKLLHDAAPLHEPTRPSLEWLEGDELGRLEPLAPWVPPSQPDAPVPVKEMKHGGFRSFLDGAASAVGYVKDKSVAVATASLDAAQARIETGLEGKRLLDEAQQNGCYDEVEKKLLAKKAAFDAAQLDEKLRDELQAVAEVYADAAQDLRSGEGSTDDLATSYEARAKALRSALKALEDFEVPSISAAEGDAIKILIAKGQCHKVRETAHAARAKLAEIGSRTS